MASTKKMEFEEIGVIYHNRTFNAPSHCLRCFSKKTFQSRKSDEFVSKTVRCPALLKFPTRSAMLVLLVLGFVNASLGLTIPQDECDPNNPESCSYGARCKQELSTRTPYYRCVCPKISCYGSWDPVCAKDGTTFFNSLCLMAKECATQRTIQPLCKGQCGTKCDAASKAAIVQQHCPREYAGFCQNGGLCIYHKKMQEAWCKCPEGFDGHRCQSKEPPTHFNQGGEKTCNHQLQLLSIFAVTLLSMVIVLLIVCICMSKRKNEDNKLWPSSERDETTPLRESTRSDYTYDSKSTNDTTSEN